MGHEWLPDESDHAGREHLDETFVAGYDRKQGSAPDVHAREDLAVLRSHGLGAGSTVVDLGAGTGRFVVAVAPHVSRVVAVDVSGPMLGRLRRRIEEELGTDDAAKVEVVQAGLLTYEHRGTPADVVHSRNTLHQLPDTFKVVALRRIADILRQDGLLRLRDLVYDAGPGELRDVLDAWFLGAAEDPRSGYTREDLVEHVRTEHSTFSWLLEQMLDRTGFDVVDRQFRRRVYASYTCVRR